MAQQRSRAQFLQRASEAGVSEQSLRQVSRELDDLERMLELTLQLRDLDQLTAEQAQLTKKLGGKGFWNDSAAAHKLTKRLGVVEAELRQVAALRQLVHDAKFLVSVAEEESGHETEVLTELADDLPKLREGVAALETRTLLTGEHDSQPALVTIKTGQGGEDATEFAQQLMDMYRRWAGQQNYPFEIQELSDADKGIRSVTFAVEASYAYGILAGESGTHRVVTTSKGKPQRAFVDVEVMPLMETTEHTIEEKDLRVDVFRSSGRGGQGVNTTDSAVRITHLPTGLVATNQNGRSQLQNRTAAMRVLEARVLEQRRTEEAAKLEELRPGGERGMAYHVRAYSSQYVRDERTKYRTTDVSAIFAGEIGEMLLESARLRARTRAEAAAQKRVKHKHGAARTGDGPHQKIPRPRGTRRSAGT